MITKHAFKDAVWIDLDSPTREEVSAISKEYELDPAVAEALVTPSHRPRLEIYDDYVYFIIHFPVFKHSHTASKTQEIDFIIGKNYILTARYDTIDALYQFSKEIEVESILRKSGDHMSARDILFVGIMRQMYKSLENELEYTRDWLDDIESKIFSGREKEMVSALSDVGRNLLDFKKATEMHSNTLHSLEIVGKKKFGDKFSSYVVHLEEEYRKVQTLIKNNTELVDELRETNNTLVSVKQNEVTQALTIMAFIAVPLSLFASLLQIDAKARPIIGSDYDFWILVGIVLFAGLVMLGFFKWKKLL